jgi:hypothetical protein
VDTPGYPAGTETPDYAGGTGIMADATGAVTDPDERDGAF